MKVLLTMLVLYVGFFSAVYAQSEWGDDIQIFDDISRGMAIDSDTTGNFYAVVGWFDNSYRIYKSTDGGLSWTQKMESTWPGQSITCFDIDVVNCSDSSYLYVYFILDSLDFKVQSYSIPNISYLGTYDIDLSNNEKEWLVAKDINWSDGNIGVGYSVNVDNNPDSTAIYFKYSTDNGVSWTGTTMLASSEDGDWHKVFDICYGYDAYIGQLYFTGSRIGNSGDFDIYYAKLGDFPHPELISSYTGEEIYPNIAVTKTIADTAKIHIVFRREENGDYKIGSFRSRDNGNQWLYQVVFDSAGTENYYPNVDIHPSSTNGDSAFIVTFKTYFSMISNGIRVMEAPDFNTFNIDHGYINNHNTYIADQHLPISMGYYNGQPFIAWTGYIFGTGGSGAYFDRLDFTSNIEEEPILNENTFFKIIRVNNLIKINFSLENETLVKLEIFDISGRSINTLCNSRYCAGNHSVSLNKNIRAGTYFINFNTENINISEKLVVF